MASIRKITRGVLVGVVVLCGFGGPIAFKLISSGTAQSLARQKAEARRLKMPLELSDVEFPHVAKEQNAASIYREIELLLRTKFQKEVSGLRRMGPIDPEFARATVTSLKPVLDLADTIPGRAGCDFERDWSKGLAEQFVELGAMRTLVRLLCMRADQQDIEGHLPAALESLKLASRVSRDAGSDPLFVGMTMRNRTHMTVNREFQALIDRHHKDPKALDTLERAIREHIAPVNILEYLRGEIVFQRIALLNSTSSWDFTRGNGAPNEFEKGLFQIKMVKEVLDDRYLAAWRVGWSKLPNDPEDWNGYFVALRDLSVFVMKDQSLGNRMNQLIFHSYAFSVDTIGVLQARDRMLLCSIELYRSYLRTGQPPTTVPAGLDETGLDPFDQKPFRLVKHGAEYRLYSIGRDRKDDGGRTMMEVTREKWSFDEVFELNY